ncbi:H/ACA RNA-protein complex component Gar1 [Methanobrevibacter filiformis]|uniref:H/ACA RNA-protein complex component Gar1 n=2 Tax=Methanobrevibacter filiformis TaxID=55758 RepID=A0A166AJY2_9EURY|nr:H/ACA RNA-protein complex component Gar1 [Methanobrevibacter filiformis]
MSNSGKLIARSSKTPHFGALIFDKNKKKIGKIANIFGPTKNPYISVRLFKSINLNKYSNSESDNLYVAVNSKKKERKSRKMK